MLPVFIIRQQPFRNILSHTDRVLDEELRVKLEQIINQLGNARFICRIFIDDKHPVCHQIVSFSLFRRIADNTGIRADFFKHPAIVMHTEYGTAYTKKFSVVQLLRHIGKGVAGLNISCFFFYRRKCLPKLLTVKICLPICQVTRI